MTHPVYFSFMRGGWLTPPQSRYSKVRLVFKERLHVTSDEIATADKLGPFLPEIGPFLPSVKLHKCGT